MSNVAEKLGDQTNLRVTDSDIESWALSAVGAIERLSPNETRSVSGYALKIVNFLFCVSMSVSCAIAIEDSRMSS
jgi:hypothetical protein